MHPRRQWALSVALVAVFVAFGLSALPSDLTAAAGAIALRDPSDTLAGIGAPVFVLRESGVAVRFGNAVATQDGAIRIGFYDASIRC